MTTTERRSQPFSGGVEFRDDKAIRGYAAVYYDGTAQTEFPLTPNVVERIHPGAFAKVLESRADMLALYHHDESQLLGRRASGTLVLEDESRGLAYSVPYDNTDPVHQSVVARIKRKDVQGSSFTFAVGDEKFERRSDGRVVRNIYSFAGVADVGPTHLPTYSGTTAEFRAAKHVEEMAARALGVEPPTPVEFF